MLCQELGWTIDQYLDLTKRQQSAILRGRREYAELVKEAGKRVRRGSSTGTGGKPRNVNEASEVARKTGAENVSFSPDEKQDAIATLVRSNSANVVRKVASSRPGKRVKPVHLRGKPGAW